MRGAVMFSAEMARAVLYGRKTMTRRKAWMRAEGDAPPAPSLWQAVEPGHRLWVREPFRGWHGYEEAGLKPSKWGGRPIWFEADGAPDVARWGHLSTRVRGARVMPRHMSRTTLIVEAVRMERVQAISSADALAEGIAAAANSQTIDCDTLDPRDEFRALWDTLHGPGSWAANPEVVVVSFSVVLKNIDAIPLRAAS